MVKSFCQLLDMAIADEKKAGWTDYQELIVSIYNPTGIKLEDDTLRLASHMILSIEKDERKHHEMLTIMWDVLCKPLPLESR